ncbi:MAG: TerC family protein [Xanthobacteraceae bacterium]|jgi:predicted tellurium resistance membrane protein TerC
MLGLLTDPNAWLALVTLSALEIVLGIDNVVFISVLVSRLEPHRATRVRQLGLALALVFRIALLFALTWMMGLTRPIAVLWGEPLSWNDVILIAGGLFLIAKATHEIHTEVETSAGESSADEAKPAAPSLAVAIAQVVLIDVVFSIDSIVTAVGMAQDIRIMIAAVLIAVGIMYVASGTVATFIAHHPTTKMLALAFLVLIGVALLADGFGIHFPRGYIYFAMAFAAAVEAMNVLVHRRRRRRRGGG